jgi:hypothetical protein
MVIVPPVEIKSTLFITVIDLCGCKGTKKILNMQEKLLKKSPQHLHICKKSSNFAAKNTKSPIL